MEKVFMASADNEKKNGIAVYIKEEIKALLVFADPKGRVLAIEIQINFKKILLVVIYAPNANQKEFYKALYTKIIELERKKICIIGDFNAVAEDQKDYKGGNKKGREIKNRELPKICVEMINELNLIDIWRKIPTLYLYNHFPGR
uniref:Endonuclease/exonuclease/phosphatase domain-containing protein n=1 Tax=Naja naja TaxID=35670 RepID=A0A8C6Y732_NAJNA